MRARSLLIATALLSAIVGGIAVYLVLTVPNDLQAGALLKNARARMAEGKTAEAQDQLSKIVQRYPRTDAAAAAVVALMALAEQEQDKLRSELAALRKAQEAQAQTIGNLHKNVDTVRLTADTAAAAAEQAKTEAAAAKPKASSVTVKKTPPKKTSTRRRR
jgi:TolA-binding protein